MRARALEQARVRLDAARKALDRVEEVTAFSELEGSWAHFLISANLVSAKLGAGAKGCPKSEMWFAQRRDESMRDDLLGYLRQARNAEEHGLERSIEHAYKVHPEQGVVLQLDVSFEPNGDLVFRRTDPPHDVMQMPLTRALGVVTDPRSGRVFHPPEQHLSRPVQARTAPEFGRLVLAYIEKIVFEADGLPVHS